MKTVGTIEEVARQVDDKWRDSFLKFVESGEAEQDFLDYIDTNDAILEAIDDAFRVQAESIDELTSELAEIRRTNPRPEVVAAGRTVKDMVDRIHNLTDAGRHDLTIFLATRLNDKDKRVVAAICNGADSPSIIGGL